MSLYSKLYDWQKPIVDFAATKSSYGLFLEMGLGKTVMALALAERLGAERIVVVTKKSKATETVDTPGSWQQWSRSMDPVPELLTKKTVPGTEPVRLLVVNYESVFKREPGEPKSKRKSSTPSLAPFIKEFVNACKFKKVCLFLDESHCIKDPSSSQAKALKQFKLELKCVAKELHTYLLTGTPFTTGFIDVWNQLKFLGCPMTKTEFKDCFCVLGNIRGLLGWQQPIVRYKNVDDLYRLIHEYAVTIKSEDVVKLPEQVFQYHKLPPTPYFDVLTKETLSLDDLRTFSARRIADGFDPLPDDYKFFPVSKTRVVNPWFRDVAFPNSKWLADTPSLLWLRARQLSAGFQGNAESFLWFDDGRLDRVRSILTDEPGNYVLFYNFVPEFLKLYGLLNELGYNVDVWNGDIKSLHFYEKYQAESEAARLTDKNNVILANFASGSTGTNWQLYDRCIIYGLPTYKDWAQGLKRIHRVDSTGTVVYHVLVGDNWLERDMLKALETGTEYSVEMFEEGLKRFS